MAKNQHYYPQFLLSFFKDGQLLSVYDREKDEFRRQGTKSIASITKYYVFKDKDGNVLVDFEDSMQDIENIAAPMLKQIISGKNTLNNLEKSELSIFLAAQLTRTPFAQKRAEAMGEALYKMNIQATAFHEKTFESFVKKIENNTKEIIEDKQGLREFMLDPEKYRIEFPRETTLKLMFENLRDIGGSIFEMQWMIVRAPEGKSFITSDNPFFSWQYKKPENILDGEALHSRSSLSIFPISPKVCLVLKYQPDLDIHFVAKGDFINSINNAIAIYSRKFVISHNDPLLRKVVERSNLKNIAPIPIGIVMDTQFSNKGIKVQK